MTTEPTSETTSSKLLSSTFLVTVASAIIYLQGYTYHIGFLYEFSLNEGLFPYNFQNLAVHIPLASLTLAIIIAPLYVISSFFLSKITKHLVGLNTSLVIIALIGALFLAAIPALSGRNEARRRKDVFVDRLSNTNQKPAKKFDKIVTLRYQNAFKNTISLRGFLVASSETYCAIYTANGVTVIPRGRIESIDIPN